MAEKRDLKADLELCNKATPGPWEVVPGTNSVSGPYPRGNNKPQENMMFIAQAREGWPHAIERAIEAEALARELVEAAGALVDDLEWSDKVYASWPPYVQRVEVLLAKAKEVLGDE